MTSTATPADATTAQQGSAIIAALEVAYAAIRERHPELPEHITITTGTGQDGRGLTWGSFLYRAGKPGDIGVWAHRVTQVRRVAGLRQRSRMLTGYSAQLFVAGERLDYGGALVLQTMLHECGHGLGAMRHGHGGCDSRGRHTREFLALAEEMGLEYTHPTADRQLGYSAVTLTDATRLEYADVIRQLDAAITVTLPHRPRGGQGSKLGLAPVGIDTGHGLRGVKAAPKGPDRNNLKCTCGCGTVVRLSRKVLALGTVGCQSCGELFAPAE